MKKIFLVFILVIFLTSFFNSVCLAQGRELEIEYPELPGVETPTKTKTALPEYLRYVFTFGIIIAGLLAFGALIYGGIRYLTSAGDPTKMADARAQITAGILGLIILLSSYLILNTINPQLVLPKKPPIEPTAGGIKIYSTSTTCQETDEYPAEKVGQSYYKLKATGTLDWGTDGKYKITSFKFLSKPGELTVKIYPENNFEGEPKSYDYNKDEEACKPFNSTDAHRSIKLEGHLPGVYLYANSEDCGATSTTGEFKDIEVKRYQIGSATLPDFNDETISIKFVYGSCDSDTGECKDGYAAILHEHENFLGAAVVAEPIENNECILLSDLTKLNSRGDDEGVDLSKEVSSITIYLKPVIDNEGEEQISGKGVRLWGDKNYTNEREEFVLPPEPPEGEYYGKDYSGWAEGYYVSKIEGEQDGSNDKISSIEMDGNYVAVLFDNDDYKGKCEVFMGSDPDLRNNPLGQCGWLGRGDCLSSFIIKARK